MLEAAVSVDQPYSSINAERCRAVGRTDPIPLPSKMDGLGLGKANIETRMLDEAIANRPRVLDSMKIANETEEQRIAREVSDSLAKLPPYRLSDTSAGGSGIEG